jgi:hypothetical protein
MELLDRLISQYQHTLITSIPEGFGFGLAPRSPVEAAGVRGVDSLDGVGNDLA